VTFEQVLIIVKYIFQFNFYPWNRENKEQQAIINPVYIFGIEKKADYAAFDLFLLFSLFIHRSILKVSKFCATKSVTLNTKYLAIAVLVMHTAKRHASFTFH